MLGPIAQSVEQRTFNPWVDGSSPSGPTQLESDPNCIFQGLRVHKWISILSPESRADRVCFDLGNPADQQSPLRCRQRD
jgi:hypothetical protein